MLVYGDPQYEQPLSQVSEGFRQRIANHDPASPDHWRMLLIEAGKLEQAVADYCEGRTIQSPRLVRAAMNLTDQAARGFYLLYNGQSAVESQTDLRELLEALRFSEDPMLTVKIPEGFAFYALFPEQYCAAALAWANDHRNVSHKQVIVVGIRSIGTTLSALVMETLNEFGLQAQRVTVRPRGHPFQRQLSAIPQAQKFKHAIVVDEGPGISGSSMVAVATALQRAGVTDISLFPGHAGEPGTQASDQVRRIWTATRKYFVPLEDLKWNAMSLTESLCQKSQEITNSPDTFSAQDISAGAWRKFAFNSESDWPAVAGQFERMKFLCTTRTGRGVLWKFAGLDAAVVGTQSSAEAAMAKLSQYAGKRLAPTPLGTFRGFVAMEWLEARRLRRKDGIDPAILGHIGNYIVQAAKPPLPAAEAEHAKARLAKMLYWNTKEGLGNEWANRTQILTESLAMDNDLPSYGDGHLAPHEWLRTARDVILKTDCEGHDMDHTLVGKQSVLWDVAGALVEWDLDATHAAILATPLREAAICFDDSALLFYQMAYAAFRMGLLSLSLTQTSDQNEQKRLKHASEYYQEHLKHLLMQEPTRLQSAH